MNNPFMSCSNIVQGQSEGNNIEDTSMIICVHGLSTLKRIEDTYLPYYLINEILKSSKESQIRQQAN